MRLPGAEAHLNKIKMMRAYDSLEENADVPDPYYGNERDFQEVFDILDRSMKTLVSELEKTLAKS